MSQDDKNLMVMVKKPDGTFKKVLLSDLKKKKDDNMSPTPLKSEAKEKEIDFDSVPETRKLENNNVIKKQPQKVVVDRNQIMGYEDKKEEKQSDIQNENKIKDRFESVKEENQKEKIKLLPKIEIKKISKNTVFTDDLLKKEKEVLKAPKASPEDFKSPLEESLPEVYKKPGELTKTTPFNSFIHKPKNVQKTEDKFVEKKIKPLVIKDIRKERPVGLSGIVKQKTPMHDIIAKTPVYGPIEEIENFSLVDLRRLSSDVGDAVNRLQQKFINIKEESIILYLKVTGVWLKSPLYKEYINKVGEALSKGVSLEKVLIGSDGIALNEIKAIIIMNKTLEI